MFIKQVPKEVNILSIPNTLKYAFKSLDSDGFGKIPSLNAGLRRYLGTVYTRSRYKGNINKGNKSDGTHSIEMLLRIYQENMT